MTMFRFPVLLCLFCLVPSFGPSRLSAEPISQVVVFGDSLSDSGNVFINTFGYYPPDPPYWQGRFSNGPTWVELWAARIGLSAAPSLAGGSNYAFGGAEKGDDTVLFISNMGTQLATYLSGNTPSGSEMFVLWGGPNDYINGQNDPLVPADNIAGLITTLHGAGAERFLIPNMPPLGQTPKYRGTAEEQTADSFAAAFNAELSSGLALLRSELGVSIVEPDVHGLFMDFLANPDSFADAYGITNFTDPALNEEQPDQYVFWDDLHPTRIAHRAIADIVPEPSSIVLLATAAAGLIALAWRRRRRASIR